MIQLLSTIYSIENLSAYTMLELVTKIINKLDEAIDELNENTDAITEIQEDILELQGIVETLGTNLQNLSQDVSAIKGVGGYLKPYDFETATPTEAQLNAYALTQITNITSPTEIWNGTRVTNLYNNHTWILNNTQNTDPVVFEWVDLGQSLVSIADNNTLGVVKGSADNLKIAVGLDGTMSVNGLDTELNGKQDTLTTTSVSSGTIDESIGFDNLGNVVRGSAGGGKLYLHNIYIKSIIGQNVILQIINQTNLQLTYSDIVSYLYNNGFTSASNLYFANSNGRFGNFDNSIFNTYGIYSNNTDLYIVGMTSRLNINFDNKTQSFDVTNGVSIQLYNTYTISDTIIAL